jgi:phosphohistidine phosphatase
MPTPLVLDLLRHGRAEPAGPAGDGGRPLTPGGRSALERLGARLEREGARHDLVFASPLVRAAESAAALLGASPDHAPVETLEALAFASSPADVLEALRGLGVRSGHVLLVGHQPQLGLLALLLTGAEAAFAPGSLVRIECPRGLRAGTGRVLLTLEPDPGV